MWGSRWISLRSTAVPDRPKCSARQQESGASFRDRRQTAGRREDVSASRAASLSAERHAARGLLNRSRFESDLDGLAAGPSPRRQTRSPSAPSILVRGEEDETRGLGYVLGCDPDDQALSVLKLEPQLIFCG